MRNPFRLKNTIESESWQVEEDREEIAFEESLAGADSQEILEREGDPKSHLGLASFLLVAVLLLIFGRLYYLTVLKHQYYSEIAQGNRLRVEYLLAPRGAIYDSTGTVLAGNKPSFELVASPLDLPKDPTELGSVIEKVAELSQMSGDEIRQIIADDKASVYESVLIKQNLSRDEALIFSERAATLPGFRVADTPIRDYRNAPDYAHVLGYVGKINAQEYQDKSREGYLYNDFLGKTGLEQVYEQYLRGRFGERQVEVDARGVVKKVFGEKPPISGNNLYLNIDAGLQQALLRALRSRLQAINRTKAAAIAMDPKSGKILAYVSLPSFDNNLFAEGIAPQEYQKLLTDKNQPLFNRAIQGTYPPGSTVKPMVASAALQEKVITQKTLVEDRGVILIRNIYGGPDYPFYGYSRKALGILDVRRAIALSSDIFFYIVGGGYDAAKIEGLGIERLASYFRKFGLGEKLGIDLPGEQAGLVPTPEWKKAYFGADPLASRWYLGDTYHVSIGQGDLLVTPLQLLSWIATIANGGTIYRPYLVDRVTDNDGKTVKQFEPQVASQVGIDPDLLRVVREGMRMAVTEGTAKSLNILEISSAAKTGTAQFDAKHPERSHAWFTAFAPYEDPKIAIAVLIEDGGEGGVNSVPVVRETLDWWSKNRYNKH